MEVMAKKDAKAMDIIAASAGGSLDDYNAQLKTTEMFYTKADAKEFFESDDVKKTMEFVRSFSFDKGLYPEGSSSKDDIGIEFPDGSVIGSKDNVKLRFDTTYLK
jgi:NitT/TauT family transport system substrate-binding protein